MITPCYAEDQTVVLEIINAAAQVYRGVIPADRWHEPYMPADELEHELADGVRFWGFEENGRLEGVAGLQDRGDVALIRHVYVRPDRQRGGVGSQLLAHLLAQVNKPVLIGTWAAASWAIRFYDKHGFRQVDTETKTRLLRRYWRIPERQVETSVVLASPHWWAEQARG